MQTVVIVVTGPQARRESASSVVLLVLLRGLQNPAQCRCRPKVLHELQQRRPDGWAVSEGCCDLQALFPSALAPLPL